MFYDYDYNYKQVVISKHSHKRHLTFVIKRQFENKQNFTKGHYFPVESFKGNINLNGDLKQISSES
jgi:hypothetical protein